MILTIHQPEHLPWLGYFNKMASAEKFVILDSVQYEKNYFQNRNKILGSNGVQWIGVPVETRGHTCMQIKDMIIANNINPKWKEKYLRTIEYGYKRYPYFKIYFPFFEELLKKEWKYLYDFNMEIIFYFTKELGINVEFVRSSELGVEGMKTDLILDICKKMKATTYVAGPSGREYLNIDNFKEAGIKVVYNDFMHPKYPQMKRKEFVPYLSTLDLLMNVGAEKAKNIVCGENFWNKK